MRTPTRCTSFHAVAAGLRDDRLGAARPTAPAGACASRSPTSWRSSCSSSGHPLPPRLPAYPAHVRGPSGEHMEAGIAALADVPTAELVARLGRTIDEHLAQLRALELAEDTTVVGTLGNTGAAAAVPAHPGARRVDPRAGRTPGDRPPGRAVRPGRRVSVGQIAALLPHVVGSACAAAGLLGRGRRRRRGAAGHHGHGRRRRRGRSHRRRGAGRHRDAADEHRDPRPAGRRPGRPGSGRSRSRATTRSAGGCSASSRSRPRCPDGAAAAGRRRRRGPPRCAAGRRRPRRPGPAPRCAAARLVGLAGRQRGVQQVEAGRGDLGVAAPRHQAAAAGPEHQLVDRCDRQQQEHQPRQRHREDQRPPGRG